MKITNAKEFPYTMDTAWKALHKPSSLDVSPGSVVTVISDTEWKGETVDNTGKAISTEHYTSSFDEEKKMVTIEGVSDKKRGHDFIYLTLTELAADKVKLEIDVEIPTGVHLISKVVGSLLEKPMEKIICRHIFRNFERLCEGKEPKRMTQEEITEQGKEFFKD